MEQPFKILQRDPSSKARTGILRTAHGEVHTPVFLPIGTKASVKGLTVDELKDDLKAEIILSNTYHLWVSPGDELIAKAGGLHAYKNWDRAIFTDSGGYQLFSLGEKLERKNINDKELPFNVKVTEQGVSFQRGDNGDAMMLTPEESMKIQANLGSDIAVALDEFTGDINNYDKVKATVERTTRWAQRCKDHWIKLHPSSPKPHTANLLLGIVQGGMIPELREQSAKEIRDIGFDGYAIGGVAVGGETAAEQYKAVDMSVPHLEQDTYKHLLGVGTPEQIIQGVARGMDSFDCVIPTREARHGRLYVGSAKTYTTIDIGKSQYKEDFEPLDSICSCYGCKHHTKAYLHHLFKSQELLGQRLLTLHNLQFYMDLMDTIRGAIDQGTFKEYI